MTKATITVFLLILFTASYSQGVERVGKTSSNASQIYLELLGPGTFYSINYDGRFGKIENGIGMRIGISGAGGNDGGYFALPVQLNYLLGNGGQYLELGGGFTYVNAALDLFDTDEPESENTLLGTATIGFRKQPFGKKGLTYRVAFTPFIGGGVGLMPWAGASIGYRF